MAKNKWIDWQQYLAYKSWLDNKMQKPCSLNWSKNDINLWIKIRNGEK